MILLLLVSWCAWAMAAPWDVHLFGVHLPSSLSLHDESHLVGFLELIVHTGVRDCVVEGWGEASELAEVKAHVAKNPMLFQRISSRLLFPVDASTHAHRFFLIAPFSWRTRRQSI